MAHTYTNLLIHALFSTKRRQPLMDAELRPKLFAYLGGIVAKLNGRPVLINGTSDHVPLLFLLPATLSLADLMEKLKANSSKWVRQGWPGRRRFAWQTGYTAFSVSQSNLEDVKRYVSGQDEHHRKVSFQQEVLVFLKKHQIKYDPRFVFG